MLAHFIILSHLRITMSIFYIPNMATHLMTTFVLCCSQYNIVAIKCVSAAEAQLILTLLIFIGTDFLVTTHLSILSTIVCYCLPEFLLSFCAIIGI